MKVLVINAGSPSIKYQLYQMPRLKVLAGGNIRAGICSGLGQIGIELNPDRNNATLGKENEISTDNSRAKIFVIPTNEEAVIAGDTYERACKDFKS